MVKKGSIFRHLAYPLGMNVTNGQWIEWMSSKFRDKFMYWKSQSWPFHVRLKVVQFIMEPMDREGFAFYLATCSIFVVEEEGLDRNHLGCVESSRNPKALGGTGILNLSKHMTAHTFSLLQDMCSKSQPWISIAQYFIENKGLKHGRTIITKWMYFT